MQQLVQLLRPEAAGDTRPSARARHEHHVGAGQVGQLGPAALLGQPGEPEAERLDDEQQPAARPQHPAQLGRGHLGRQRHRQHARLGQDGVDALVRQPVQRPRVGPHLAAPARPAPSCPRRPARARPRARRRPAGRRAGPGRRTGRGPAPGAVGAQSASCRAATSVVEGPVRRGQVGQRGRGLRREGGQQGLLERRHEQAVREGVLRSVAGTVVVLLGRAGAAGQVRHMGHLALVPSGP